ncbi:uncharacterized protein LOC130446307 [Diorhabda sublineata]|uniref:uncharacterized protein LOC130446307 n=1 Tax=Diorhabda sublineata TaxID=1163346 RepID=UPI0024E170C1|nr:uncharacterized protein LOC130446307 [Diorhabda sublineata]
MSQKKINFKSKSTPLKRSVSTTSLGLLFNQHLNLRDTKSYTGGMDDNKSTSSEDNEVTNDKKTELTPKQNQYLLNAEVETKDKSTNETVKVKTEILCQGGRTYSLNDLAYVWKKDCRIWLWKNCAELKLNKSIGDRMKSGLNTLDFFKY